MAGILRNIGWIILYFFVGCGPGFIVGLMIANRIWGRGQPTLMEHHEHHKAEAIEHNKQLDPKHPRWQKS